MAESNENTPIYVTRRRKRPLKMRSSRFGSCMEANRGAKKYGKFIEAMASDEDHHGGNMGVVPVRPSSFKETNVGMVDPSASEHPEGNRDPSRWSPGLADWTALVDMLEALQAENERTRGIMEALEQQLVEYRERLVALEACHVDLQTSVSPLLRSKQETFKPAFVSSTESATGISKQRSPRSVASDSSLCNGPTKRAATTSIEPSSSLSNDSILTTLSQEVLSSFARSKAKSRQVVLSLEFLLMPLHLLRLPTSVTDLHGLPASPKVEKLRVSFVKPACK